MAVAVDSPPRRRMPGARGATASAPLRLVTALVALGCAAADRLPVRRRRRRARGRLGRDLATGDAVAAPAQRGARRDRRRRRGGDRRPARLADGQDRPPRTAHVDRRDGAAARHPELHRRLPARLGARAAAASCRASSRRSASTSCRASTGSAAPGSCSPSSPIRSSCCPSAPRCCGSTRRSRTPRAGWAGRAGRCARTVVLPQLIPAIGAGALLAALYALSDFGAVSILRFDSFTRVIYQSYRASFDRTGAAALAALLVLVMIGLLAAEARVRRGRTYHRTAPGSARALPVLRLGAWRWPALAFCARSALLAFGLPVAMLVYWSARASPATWTGTSSRPPPRNSLLLAGLARARHDRRRRCPSPGSARASRVAGRPPWTPRRPPATRCPASSWRSPSSSSASARCPCSTSRSRCS